MHTKELFSANTSSKGDVMKWKQAYADLYDPQDGALRNFKGATTAGREYVFIRKNLNEMIAELHIMRKEANTSDKSPSVNAENGSEYYALQNALKTLADTAKKVDAENSAKLKESMENVETMLGIRSEGSLTSSPLVPASYEDDTENAPCFPSDAEFNLPKNSGPYAPIRVRPVARAPSVDIASREFFNENHGQKRKASDNTLMHSARTAGSNTGLTHSDRTGTVLHVVGTPSYTSPRHSDRTGNVHHPEPGMKNRDLIDEIDNGNDIVTQNIGRLQTILDSRGNCSGLATTGQVLSNIGSFISSVRDSNLQLSQRAESVGEQLLDQIIDQAGLSK